MPFWHVHAIAARLIAPTTQHSTVLEDVFATPTMRKDVIRLGRRRRPRVYIIEQHMTRRAVRDTSGSAGREHPLTPMLVLTRARPGGHQGASPPLPKSNGPPLTRKATLEIYTVARDPQDLPPGCFTPPPGGWFQTSPGTEHPPGCLQAPPGGGFGRPSGHEPPPGACGTARGWLGVRTRARRCPRRGRCGARPHARPAAASAADTTTARSRP